MLSVEIQAEILALYFNDKRSVRSIAREFGLNRESVRRLVERRSVNQCRQIGKRESILDSYKEEINKLLEKDVKCPARAILVRLRTLGYTGGITVLQQYVRTIRLEPVRKREAFLRLTFEPGETAQVDWGEFGDVFGDGVKIHCFGMVLCHSRYMYLEFTRTEKFEDFIRGHEHAFKFFGGIPRECWYDNLASAVTERYGSLIRFNARFMAYMGHHGIRPHACNVARGNEKGRVEGLIKYVRNNFWSGRSFVDFEDLIKQSIVWRNDIANQREHRATRRVVRLLFESSEKPALLPMNPAPYNTDEVFSKVVPPDFHITYDTNRYSLPWTLVGMTITVRVNASQLKIYYHEKHIASHERSYRRHRVFTNESHQKGLLERKPGSTREGWQLLAVKNIGPKMSEYVELVRSGQRSLRSELARILALSTIYGEVAVHDACEELLKAGVIGVEALEITLKRLHHPSASALKLKPIEFTNEKLNRTVPAVDLRRYDALLFEHGQEIKPTASKGADSNGFGETDG